MILSSLTIRELEILEPCVQAYKAHGVSVGLSHAGYDLSLDGQYLIAPGEFILVSAKERFTMPKDVVGIVHDKSTWARRGITVQNTVIEPGWCGYLTLEICNHSRSLSWVLEEGVGIAQVVFHRMDRPVEGYNGKYQNQERGPQGAR